MLTLLAAALAFALPLQGKTSDERARSTTLDVPRVLFFTHSAGFVHDVVKRPAPDKLAPAEQVLTEIATGRYQVTCSQDCADISAANLAHYQAVVFMTTSGQEKDLPVPGNGNQELVDWVAHGGAFVGLHCATDTNYHFAPYVEMLGGSFDGHPWHEEITARVEDARHPICAGLESSFAITDEIYQFKNWRRHPLRVLLTLDPASVDIKLGKRADGDYALAWTHDWGEGRVFYTGLGHREEVWRDARFQRFLLNGIEWALHGPDVPALPPPGAKVLFGGKDLSAWQHRDGKAPGWRLVDSAMEVVPGTDALLTKDALGDGLYHVEFMTPSMPEATGQARGNSGVYLQDRYEVQVLDSYGLVPQLGDCAAIYGKRVPNVNACRPPGRWQTYDIEFRAPRFDAAGKKSANARLTVWHNGRLVHEDVEVDGPTAGGSEEAALGPLMLQDHGNLVRYRDVWYLPR